MKSQAVAKDVSALLRARNPLLWIVTTEEARVERYLIEAAGAAGYIARTWDVAQGVVGIDGKTTRGMGGNDIADTLATIKARSESGPNTDVDRGVWILRDLPIWIEGAMGASALRAMRNLARSLPGIGRDRAQAMIVISPSNRVPPELANHATVIDWPLPDREEIAAILDSAINSLPEEVRGSALLADERDAAIDAAVGLTGEEAASCYARSLVQLRKIDLATVSGEKRRVIARENVLEWFDPLPGGMNSVGGLVVLKSWLYVRKEAYTAAARAYGLPAPKGVFLAGISGCGKSLIAKAIATAWGVPLLRVDLGALKSKFVGESESNLRKAFDVISAIGRCVVWFDEVEKALAGATQGAADGGVSSDALGAILTWMNERQGEAFVVATANEVQDLPPEFLRKGRFDEVFWVDLPTRSERSAILEAALRANGRDATEIRIDLDKVAEISEGFTGSEIASLVPDALFAGFSDGAREITTEDLTTARKSVVPLSTTMAEKITTMRDWAKGRARPASLKEEGPSVASSDRRLDL